MEIEIGIESSGNGMITMAVKARLIYSSKNIFGFFDSNGLVDFFHLQ
jgi:hypothetical protein